MAVNFGSNEIKVYLGNKEVTSMHFGEKEVYKKPSTFTSGRLRSFCCFTLIVIFSVANIHTLPAKSK